MALQMRTSISLRFVSRAAGWLPRTRTHLAIGRTGRRVVQRAELLQERNQRVKAGESLALTGVRALQRGAPDDGIFAP